MEVYQNGQVIQDFVFSYTIVHSMAVLNCKLCLHIIIPVNTKLIIGKDYKQLESYNKVINNYNPFE